MQFIGIASILLCKRKKKVQQKNGDGLFRMTVSLFFHRSHSVMFTLKFIVYNFINID